MCVCLGFLYIGKGENYQLYFIARMETPDGDMLVPVLLSREIVLALMEASKFEQHFAGKLNLY